MEAISLKLDEHMLSNIDQNLRKHNYSTRTEFIRSAIREKLEEINREQLAREFLQFKGKAKTKTTRRQNHKTAELTLGKYVKKMGWEH